MDILKAAPELLAEYLDFLVASLSRPKKSMEERTAEGAAAKISGKLVLFSLLGTGTAMVVAVIGAAIGMAPDDSFVVKVAARVGEKFLPLATLVLIVAGSIVAHVVLRVVGLVGTFLGHEPFHGAVVNSINAALGIAACWIPLMTMVITAVRVASAHGVEPQTLAFILIIMPFALAFWFYLVVIFAAAHRISAQRFGALFALTCVFTVLLRDMF